MGAVEDEMTLTQQVSNILAVSRQARNSDKELQILYMQKFGMNLSQKQIDTFREMPSLESIRRVRQKLQEQGEYPADQNIKKERDWRAMRMQQNAPTAKPKTIEYIIEPWKEGEQNETLSLQQTE